MTRRRRTAPSKELLYTTPATTVLAGVEGAVRTMVVAVTMSVMEFVHVPLAHVTTQKAHVSNCARATPRRRRRALLTVPSNRTERDRSRDCGGASRTAAAARRDTTVQAHWPARGERGRCILKSCERTIQQRPAERLPPRTILAARVNGEARKRGAGDRAHHHRSSGVALKCHAAPHTAYA
jgi:hypothetical protein